MQFAKKILPLLVVMSLPALMVGCGGDDGKNGVNGTNGTNGSNGSTGASGTDGKTSLIKQTVLMAGDTQCFSGGVKIESGIDANSDNSLQETEVAQTTYQCDKTALNNQMNFNRVATFPVCLQINSTCNTSDETAAEIVAASTDGMTLIYTDSLKEQIGFVDISNPSLPKPKGVLAMGGEPTSIAVKGGYALVGVDTSTDFINASGDFVVVDIATQMIVHRASLGGQPDSVAISPDGKFAVIVIENQRDEDLGDGAPPQLPAGKVVVLNLIAAAPADWVKSDVDLTGLAALYPADPEPEYVDINSSTGTATDTKDGVSNPSGRIQTLADYLRIVYQSLDMELLTIDTTPTINNTAVGQPFKMNRIPNLPIPKRWNETFVLGTDSNPLHWPLKDEPYLNWKNSLLRVSSTPPPITTSNNTALVCITGQMGRLELENKFERLLKPMYEEGGYDSIDLTFVVTPGKAIFQAGKDPGKDPSKFRDESDIRNYLQGKQNGTSMFRNVQVRPFTPSPNLPPNPQYLLQKGLQIFYGSEKVVSLRDEDFQERISIPLINIKMMQAYQHCYTDQDVASVGEYDLYVRLRDDVGFEAPKVPPHLYNRTVVPDRSYLTHGNKSNGGINDRMAFLRGQQAALCYFHLPFLTMYNGRPIDVASGNTESYFKRLYWLSNGCIDTRVVTGDKVLLPGKLALGEFKAV